MCSLLASVCECVAQMGDSHCVDAFLIHMDMFLITYFPAFSCPVSIFSLVSLTRFVIDTFLIQL